MFFRNFVTYVPDCNTQSEFFNDAVSYSVHIARMIDERTHVEHCVMILIQDTDVLTEKKKNSASATFSIAKYSVIMMKTTICGLSDHTAGGRILYVHAVKLFTTRIYLIRIQFSLRAPRT